MPTDPATRPTPYPTDGWTAGHGLLTTGIATAAAAVPLAVLADAGMGYPVKAALVVTALALLVQADRQVELGPADLVTLTRAAVTAWVVAFVGESVATGHATVLWFGAGLAFFLDAVDGKVARHTGTASPAGARLDMELDGLTVLGLTALLWWLDRTGSWVLAGGALRYIWIVASWGFPWMNRALYPTPRRAWMCGVHLMTTIFAILPWPVAWLSPVLAATGLAALLYSFGTDFRWLFAHREEPC